MFLSPCEDTAFTISAAHEKLNVLTIHSLRTYAVLERIRVFEIYTMFM